MEAHTEADTQTYGNSIAGNKGHLRGRVISVMVYTGKLRPRGVGISLVVKYVKG